jgi:hypothetical protein
MSIEKKGREKENSGGVATSKVVTACPASFRPRDRPKGQRQPCKPRKTHERPALTSTQPRISGVSTARWNLLKGQSDFHPPRNPGSIEDLLDLSSSASFARDGKSWPATTKHTTRMPDRDQYIGRAAAPHSIRLCKLRLLYLVIPQTATRYRATIKASICTPTSARNPLDATGTGYLH